MSHDMARPDRRHFLAGSAGVLAGTAQPGKGDRGPSGCVRDRLWVWAHEAGVYNGAYGLPGTSRITPTEGAHYLGVPNVILIRYEGKPAPPFEQYALPFRSLRRVMWSVTGAGGATSEDERRHVLALARKTPAITGVFMDDFFHAGEPHWLARNEVRFPVALTVTFPAPVAADRLVLVQSRWPTGDYRSAAFEVDTSADGKAFRKAGNGTLPNRPGAEVEVSLPAGPLLALRVTILSTHDTGAAHSCGLSGLRLLRDGRAVPWDGARAAAASEYPGHLAATLVDVDAPAPAALSVDQIRALRRDLKLADRTLDLGVTLYTHQIHSRLRAHLDLCDLVSLWTWRSADLAALEDNFARFVKLVPDRRRLLGLYLWDFGDHKPMPLALMKKQVSLGLRWLQQGRVDGLVFLGTNVCDLGLDTVEWSRSWIAEVGPQALTPAPSRG